MSKRNLRLIAIIIVALVLLVWLLNREKPVAVTVVAADRGDVAMTVANTRAGTVKACQRARLMPSASGQIGRILVHEGDQVRKGQVLLELWNDDLAAQVELARRETHASEQSKKEICLLAAAAEREAQRLLALQRDQLASEEAVDKAVTQAKSRQAGCHAAKSRIKISQARLKVAQAALERTRLRAPFDGQVAEINGAIGEFITPAAPAASQALPAVDLIDTSCLYIAAPIDEVDAPAITPGMVAKITLDAFPGQSFLGAVRRVAPYVLAVEKQSRTVEVEAVFMDPEQYRPLLPGYSADLEIVLEQKQNVTRIPTEALLEDDTVLILNEDGIIEKRRLRTGLSNWKFTEVLEGVREGERIITSVDRKGVREGVSAVAEQDSNPA